LPTRTVNERPSGSRCTSHEDFETSMPIKICGVSRMEPSMEGTLSCGCELGAGARRPLWRLFGLIPRDRRRSRFSTASPGEPRGRRSVVGRAEVRCAARLGDLLIEL
jgi:hypothetical protein